jgi:hypothetical protein
LITRRQAQRVDRLSRIGGGDPAVAQLLFEFQQVLRAGEAGGSQGRRPDAELA